MISNHISIKSVIAKLYRDLNLSTEIAESDVIEWIAEALDYIGGFGQLETKVDYLEIDNFKGKRPLDLHQIIYISYNNKPLYYTGKSLANNVFCKECKIPLCCGTYNFYVNDSYIITDIEKGKICLEYYAIPTDDEGYPLIPDNVYYMKALTAYVTKMLDYQNWRKGLIPDKIFQHSEKEWMFYVGAAKGSANMPSLSQLENIKNILVRLIPKTNEFQGMFKNLHSPEKKYIH